MRGPAAALGLPGFYPSVEPRRVQAGPSALGPVSSREPGTLADNDKKRSAFRSSRSTAGQSVCHPRKGVSFRGEERDSLDECLRVRH